MELLADKHERLAMPKSVLSPYELDQRFPLNETAEMAIMQHRREVADILSNADQRLLVVVGPCSLDTQANQDGNYIVQLAEEMQKLSQTSDIASSAKLIMRAPPAKPRTNLGQAGLEQSDISKSYELLSEIANRNVSLAIEMMRERHFTRYGKLLSLGWIGARSVEDTYLRHAAAAHPDLPVLFKNATTGSVKPVEDAAKTAAGRHEVELTDEHNYVVVEEAPGNQHTGMILRGGSEVINPKTFADHVAKADKSGIPFLIDCAHGNAMAHDVNNQKSVAGQLACLEHVLEIMRERPPKNLKGVMLEAHYAHDLSLTDPCMDKDEMVNTIKRLAITHAEQR